MEAYGKNKQETIMPTIIRAYDNENKAIIGKGHGLVPLT